MQEVSHKRHSGAIDLMLKRNKYPKQVHVGTEIYQVKFVRKLSKGTVGECDPESFEIRILCGQGRVDTLKTFIHEVMHAIELEHEIEIDHKLIYALETPIFQLLRDNLF